MSCYYFTNFKAIGNQNCLLKNMHKQNYIGKFHILLKTSESSLEHLEVAHLFHFCLVSNHAILAYDLLLFN